MFERIKKIIWSFPYLILSVILTAIIFYSSIQLSPSEKAIHSQFQNTFEQKVNELDAFSENLLKRVSVDKEIGFSVKEFEQLDPYFVHVYRNDSLVFWNTTTLPVSNFADLHFPVNGVVQLQNGWYFVRVLQKGKLKLVVSFGIKHDYPVTNASLKNSFFTPFDFLEGELSLNSEIGNPILSESGQALFYFKLQENSVNRNADLMVIYFSILGLLGLLCLKVNAQKGAVYIKIGFAVLLIILRVYLLKSDVLLIFSQTRLFDPSLFALNEWVPNLGELLIWIVVSLYVSFTFLKVLNDKDSFKRIRVFFYLVIFVFIGLILPLLADTMVENSTIPLQLNALFSLDRYTVLILILFGIGGFVFVRFVRMLLRSMQYLSWKVGRIILGFGVAIGLQILLGSLFTQILFSALLWTISLSLVTFIVVVRFKDNWTFTSVLLAVLVFAAGSTVNIAIESDENEHQVRELYANQLADDRDVSAEVEFVAIPELILTDSYTSRLFSAESKPSFTELKEAMERRVFNGFWERYDVDCYFFNSDSVLQMNGYSKNDLDRILKYHGQVSETSDSLFFIEDYTSQFNYIFRFPIQSDDQTVVFYGTLKSKRIPEKIGFPRLLVSEKSNVYESLESYSIGKYYKGNLVSSNGAFSYPIHFSDIGSKMKGGSSWIESENYSHFIVKRSLNDAIILSKVKTDFFDRITTLAFLLVGFGGLLFIGYVCYRFANGIAFQTSLSLAVKIQVVMIFLVVLSLIAFSLGTSTYVTKQYELYANDAVRERIRSVEREASVAFGRYSNFNKVHQAGHLDFELKRLAKVFVTDINVYLPNGRLVSSSRPKIYNIGLSSEQMNPMAMYNMLSRCKSEYIHEEKIGELVYLSAYVPFKNDDKKIIGYLNLQHFDQQNVFEDQLQRFFIAIVNVFMLLLVISIVGAILVSGWLTKPLRMIRASLSRVEIGKNNQRLKYKSKDEVGELIEEYNAKLVELEVAARQLAQSERESAWREMAKQVAHEIKNPLTPMKLSLQQLQRVYDPNDPNTELKFKRVSQSIIEQIDALANIANAFSNFAKLPQPVMEQMDLVVLVQTISDFYNGEYADTVLFERKVDSVLVSGDREMLMRVWNNLITNGIQACQSATDAKIVINLRVELRDVIVTITDNGQGIPDEQLETIFEPYFTTKSTGTGLGLAMVKQILESHNGSIEVSSSSHKGTVFTVTLPII